MFSSLAEVMRVLRSTDLDHPTDTADQIRANVVRYAEEHPNDIMTEGVTMRGLVEESEPMDTYLERMRRRHEWGGAPEIYAAAYHYDITIVVYTSFYREPALIASPPGSDSRTVYLWFLPGHYQALIPTGSSLYAVMRSIAAAAVASSKPP